MIKRYSDHAANERTFLAWVRTSIAVIAFGFLVERFDLFLVFAASAVGKAGTSVPRTGFGHVAGLVLIVLGIAMIVISAWRFTRPAEEIGDGAPRPGRGSRIDLALAMLLALLAAVLLLYLVHVLASKA